MPKFYYGQKDIWKGSKQWFNITFWRTNQLNAYIIYDLWQQKDLTFQVNSEIMRWFKNNQNNNNNKKNKGSNLIEIKHF